MAASESNLDIAELNQCYSTTRKVTKVKPVINYSPDNKIQAQCALPPSDKRKGEGGLRTRGYFKKQLENKPLISVITVVFNGALTIEKTIQSVIGQNYDNVEYIIIDGASTDRTVEIIKKYDEQIDYWISEPDEGIYQAMNKGTSLASGDWLLYMNADDWIYAPEVLKNVHDNQSYDVDLLIGDFAIIYSGYEKPARAGKVENLWKGMQFCHQSIFFSRKLMFENGYETHFKIAADYNLLYQALIMKGVKYKYINQIIAAYRMGGLSDKYILTGQKECSKVVLDHKNNVKTRFYMKYKLANLFIRLQIKKIIPEEILNSLRKIIK